jgi:hypothetical protein
VEALRGALQSALKNHDLEGQCDLFSPALIYDHGGSVQACANKLRTESGPYSPSLGDYVAGGRIELLGNRAEYQAPPGTSDFAASEASDGESGTATVFVAVYAEGTWRLTDRSE